jgi:tRNA(Arg) A34 adenosine deaminase TadA
MRDPGLDIFDKAIALAKKSTMQQKHGAIVVYNGEILGQGFNHMASFMSHSWSCHAEMGAILSIRKKDKWKICESTLVVVRVGSDARDREIRYQKNILFNLKTILLF